MRKIIFVFTLLGTFFPLLAFADVRVNEIAWMGTQNSAQDEWIELYSASGESLEGWILKTADGGMFIPLSGNIPAGGFFLIERTDDTTVPNIPADQIAPFGSGLSNSGEILILLNASGEEKDKVDASGGWPAGDNATKDTMQKAGDKWITAPGTPKAENKKGSSNVSPTPTPTPTNVSQDRTADKIPPKDDAQKMSAEINLIDTGIAGAEIFFEGRAFGFDGKETNADRYVWNFGDGARASGKNVPHSYQFPGVYQVSFTISKGEYSASAYDSIEIVPSEIYISEIKPGQDSWIEIRNGSSKKIDISGWSISSDNKKFTFPSGTFISSNAYLVIPENISGIVLDAFSGDIKLTYYSGKIADSFKYSGNVSQAESFSRIGPDIKIVLATPGKGEEKIIAKTVIPPEKKLNNSVSTKKSLENNALISENIQNPEVPSEKREIPSLTSSSFFSTSGFYWGLLALGVGFLAALGFVVANRIK